MPQFQLEVAIILAVSAACSLVIFYLTREKGGQIKLPIHGPLQGDAEYDETKPDPFNVTQPEDLIDGDPIDANKFWAKVCAGELTKQ